MAIRERIAGKPRLIEAIAGGEAISSDLRDDLLAEAREALAPLAPQSDDKP